MPSISNIAKALGRLGGLARAKRLTADHKKRIASSGGKSRATSLLATRRIVENFRYVEAMQALAPQSPQIKRVKTCKTTLPGHYAKAQ